MTNNANFSNKLSPFFSLARYKLSNFIRTASPDLVRASEHIPSKIYVFQCKLNKSIHTFGLGTIQLSFQHPANFVEWNESGLNIEVIRITFNFSNILQTIRTTNYRKAMKKNLDKIFEN